MSTIQETLRKARQVDEKFKAFMIRKQQSDKSMQQTMRKIKETQQTIAQTKQTIGKIDNLYDSFQKRFSEVIDLALKNVQKSVLFNVADPNWIPNRINQKQFVKQVKDHKHILILTGAGMSVASGIPTFRGAKGFWDKQNLKNQIFQNVKTPQQILTLKHFQQNQFLTWKWLVDFFEIKQKAKPNKGHFSLNSIISQLINVNKGTMIVTQNIDGFHLQAQQEKKEKKEKKETKEKYTSKNKYKICQIHGDINKLRCDDCSAIKNQVQFYQFKDYLKDIQLKRSPRCPKCDGKLRPHIMFFDQCYSQLYNQSQTVMNFQKQSDLVIVIGTALQTGLSRKIVQQSLEKKVPIIQINIECQIKRPGTMWMQGKADEIIDKIKFQIWKNGL